MASEPSPSFPRLSSPPPPAFQGRGSDDPIPEVSLVDPSGSVDFARRRSKRIERNFRSGERSFARARVEPRSGTNGIRYCGGLSALIRDRGIPVDSFVDDSPRLRIDDRRILAFGFSPLICASKRRQACGIPARDPLHWKIPLCAFPRFLVSSRRGTTRRDE